MTPLPAQRLHQSRMPDLAPGAASADRQFWRALIVSYGARILGCWANRPTRFPNAAGSVIVRAVASCATCTLFDLLLLRGRHRPRFCLPTTELGLFVRRPSLRVHDYSLLL